MAQNTSSTAQTLEDKYISLKIDITELTPAQVRLIKTINALLISVMTTESEKEFFEDSAEFMRYCASLIKQSCFAEMMKNEKIPYADQALEYSMDILQENMSSSRIVSYDN